LSEWTWPLPRYLLFSEDERCRYSGAWPAIRAQAGRHVVSFDTMQIVAATGGAKKLAAHLPADEGHPPGPWRPSAGISAIVNASGQRTPISAATYGASSCDDNAAVSHLSDGPEHVMYYLVAEDAGAAGEGPNSGS